MLTLYASAQASSDIIFIGYTPQWDNAEMSQNNRTACVDNGGYVTIGNNLTDAFGAGNITGVRPFSDKMPFVICN